MNDLPPPLSSEDYKSQIIVFIDILGISEFVAARAATDRHSEVLDVYSVLNRMRAIKITDVENITPQLNITISTNNYLKSSLQKSILSDTVVVTLEKTKVAYLPKLIREINILQVFLLAKHGLLTRGVIMEGFCLHDSKSGIIFGDGLVKAHQMGKKLGVPKVIITQELVDELSSIYKDQQTLLAISKETAELLTGRNDSIGQLGAQAFWLSARTLLDGMFVEDKNHKAITFFEKELMERFQELSGISWHDLREVILKNYENQIDKLKDAINQNDADRIKEYSKRKDYWFYISQLFDLALDKYELITKRE